MSVLSYQNVSPGGGLFGDAPADDFSAAAFKRGPRDLGSIPFDAWQRQEDAARRQTARPAPLGSQNTDAARRRRLARLQHEDRKGRLQRIGRPTNPVAALAPYHARVMRLMGGRWRG